MFVELTDTPCRVEGLFTMSIDGNTLYYNPQGFGGITVVDGAISEMISLCDGLRSVEDIAKRAKGGPESVLVDVQTLSEREVLQISPTFTAELRNGKRKKLFTGWLHLTNQCNLACEYCYIHKSPGDMTLEIARLAIDKMLHSCRRAGFAALKVKFSGGEPLLRFDILKKVVDHTEDTKGDIAVSYLLLTNSTLVTSEVAEYLASSHFSVGTSLDGLGLNHDIARHTCSGAGSFQDTITGIDVLRAHGVEPTINVTITDTNYRNLRELTGFLLDQGLRFRYSLQRDTDTGKPAILKHEPSVIDELMACYDMIEEDLPAKDITLLHKFGDVVLSRPINKSCGAGGNSLAVGHDGRISVCGLGLASPKGSLFDEGDLHENIKFNNAVFLSRTVADYEVCSNCVWRGSCAGACPLQTFSTYGRFNTQSPYCEIYKAVLPRILRIKGLQMIREFNQRQEVRR